jgi:hypothetical protein
MIEQTETQSSSRTLKVFLGGLPSHWEAGQVSHFMQGFGRVVGVQIKRDLSGYSKGFGFVYLEDHIDPKMLYGKHQYNDTVIEIKELKQKHIYMSFGTPSPKVSENLILRSLLEQGHPVEMIEVGGKATQGIPNIAKINFVHDSSAKYFLHKKFVDIDRMSYNVFSSIDYLKPKMNSPTSRHSKGKSQAQAVGDYGHAKRFRNFYNYHENHQDDSSRREESKIDSSKPKKSLNKSPEDSFKQLTGHPDETTEKEFNGEPKVSVIQTSTQSSDDQLSTGKVNVAEPTRSTRKLSYKGKEIEFHPFHLSEETPQLVVVESSPRNTELPSDFSSSSRDQQSSVNKLSSSSVDWKLENLVMGPPAIYTPQMLYSLYSQIPAGASYYPALKKSAEWLAPKDAVFEQHKKKEVRIEFFTFPGFV